MPLKYTKMPLDRSSNLRTNPEWLASQLKREDAKFVLVDQGLNLFDSDGKTILLDLHILGEVRIEDCIFLGLADKSPLFSLAFDSLRSELQAALTEQYQFLELKSVVHNFSDEEAAIHGFSKALHHWHNTHKYCGLCGSTNSLINAGHSRKCDNLNCGHLTFPRTDPAVIMLVEHTFPDGTTRCLLGRQSTWPTGAYSTLAGFVDPGESLEEAVIRETKEETGVDVENVRYLGSQPWPFPSSIMLGFIAEACSPEINVDYDEIEDARWFSREDLEGFSEWQDEGAGFKKTRKESISRALLDMWHYQRDELCAKT